MQNQVIGAVLLAGLLGLVGCGEGSKVSTSLEPTQTAEGVWQLRWEHLIPVGFEPETIMAKYDSQMDAIVEGSPEEEALMEKIMQELNHAPGNANLNGKRVRLPGFISPLQEKDGRVAEFLLVPYSGAGTDQPASPVNQTLLVRPIVSNSVRMEDIYEPVWVTGDIKVATYQTSLSPAGYLIENASLAIYTEADAAADAAAEAALADTLSQTRNTSQ